MAWADIQFLAVKSLALETIQHFAGLGPLGVFHEDRRSPLTACKAPNACKTQEAFTCKPKP